MSPMPQLVAQPPRLLVQVRDAVRRRHYSYRTEKAYLYWVRRYVLFHRKRHPAEMGESEISAFLTHLAVERRVSASTQNQAFNALLFLYKQVLNRDVGLIQGVTRAVPPHGINARGSAGDLSAHVRPGVVDGWPDVRSWVACYGVPPS